MKRLFLIFFAVFFPYNSQASVISDFSWIPTGPNTTASTILPDGTLVTLITNPIPFDDFFPGSARVFKLNDPRPANITLTFSRTIADLRLLIDDLDPSAPETLSGFSVEPTSVDGFLSINFGVVTSLQENSGGNLFWDDLYASSITFTFNRCGACGLYLRELEFTTVSLPSSLWLFGAGLIAFLIPVKRSRGLFGVQRINASPAV